MLPNKELYKKDYRRVDPQIFDNQEVLQLGGSHEIRYAVVTD